MKKFNKIAAMVLSAIAAGALCAGSAMAAELPDEDLYGAESVSSATDGIGASDWEQELERLKSLNPDKTDEQWELISMIENPEANGLVKVGETSVTEDGLTFEQTIYTYEAMPTFEAIGQGRFYAFSKIFEDGDPDKQLLWKTYLNADISWNNIEHTATVDRVQGDDIKHCQSEFPEKVGGYSYFENNKNYNFNICAHAYYNLVLHYGGGVQKTYTTEMKVTSFGEQVVGNESKIQ